MKFPMIPHDALGGQLDIEVLKAIDRTADGVLEHSAVSNRSERLPADMLSGGLDFLMDDVRGGCWTTLG